MGENSGIQWTHHTFNPWTRCTKVSPACDNCYAETWAKRAKRPQDDAGNLLPIWGADAPREMTSAHNWKQPLRWNREAIDAGERRRVFCASLADVFEEHPALADGAARSRLWALIDQCRGLDWLLLTKRPENVLRMVPRGWLITNAPEGSFLGWPRHVWIGCTVESQAMADARIPHLLRVPAPVRFLSVEPQIESIDLTRIVSQRFPGKIPAHVEFDGLRGFCGATPAEDGPEVRGVQWVIQGGESGAKARQFWREWARSMRDQCRAAGVAYFYKQEGANVCELGPNGERFTGILHRDSHGGDEAEFPHDLRGCRAFPEVDHA